MDLSPPKCTGEIVRLTGKHLMTFMNLIKEENGVRVWSCEVCPAMHVEFTEERLD